jgi:hypothetical protein
VRIYTNPLEAVREVERDLWEMGINVHTATYQDKEIGDDPDMATKEVRGYGFSIVDWSWDPIGEQNVIYYFFDRSPRVTQRGKVLAYINQEFLDRTSGFPANPGHAWEYRRALWEQFRDPDTGRFHYTYAERIAPQLHRIMRELQERPTTRQAIINIHSNILPIPWEPDDIENRKDVDFPPTSADLINMGGSGRVPCSMYYQLMIRDGKVDLIYCMRSCDFLTHFPVDIMLALRIQSWFASSLGLRSGRFTYFAGSLHAFVRDMRERGVF